MQTDLVSAPPFQFFASLAVVLPKLVFAVKLKHAQFVAQSTAAVKLQSQPQLGPTIRIAEATRVFALFKLAGDFIVYYTLPGLPTPWMPAK